MTPQAADAEERVARYWSASGATHGGAWRRVLATEPPAPCGACLSRHGGPDALSCDFEAEGGMTPAGPICPGLRATIGQVGAWEARSAASRGAGMAGRTESPYLPVEPGKPCVVRLSVKQGFTSGAARVFLFKYDAERMPLDLPVREQAGYGPALIGQIEPGEQWQRRRLTKQIEPGVAYVRLYIQCFGVQGQTAFDDITVGLEAADPSLVDDCDEPGGWKTGFPEASLTRETATVRQGDGALRFSVSVDHKGGEAVHPVGWPHLRCQPSPPLDWTGKQATREANGVTFGQAASDSSVISQWITKPVR